jgi:hypothetical protein
MWERLHNKKPQAMEQVFDSIITHHNLERDVAMTLETIWRDKRQYVKYYSTQEQLAQLMLESLGNIIKLEISETKVH